MPHFVRLDDPINDKPERNWRSLIVDELIFNIFWESLNSVHMDKKSPKTKQNRKTYLLENLVFFN